jgi:MYXO-CTERM domain-containing protein
MRRSAPRALFAPVLLWATVALADPSGHKWYSSSLPVQYRVFAHSSINGVTNFSTTALPAVQSGFESWTSNKVSCTFWIANYAGSFSSPTGLNAIADDGNNRVIWLGGSQWVHGSSTLGLTTTTYWTHNGQVTDGDIEMNNNHPWKVGGNANALDVESITVHEAGHFLGLDHSSPTSAIMYATYPYGSIKRTLTQTDITDVCTVYPSGASAGVQGDPCTQDSQCSSGLYCRGPAGGTSKICTRVCSASNTSCPTGYTCQNASPSGMACLTPVGAADLCKFCTAGSDCSTGNCVTDGQRNWCTHNCTVDADCGTGYSCVPSATSLVCVPNTSCPVPQCSTGADCAIGYGCVGGMCTATGNPGDRCEISLYCKSCSICIGTYQEAYCRSCCGGATGTGGCQGCTNTSCPTGFTCYSLSVGTDQVCAPSGVPLCQACDAQTPCQSGLQCVNQRCHSSCNPTNPGTCQACYATGTTTGFCACPDEVAQTGQACGQTSQGLRVCVTGNVCVGDPPTCRAQCTLGNDATCPGGQSCQSVGGHAVCIQGSVAGQLCAGCENGVGCAPGLTCWSGRCYQTCLPTQPSCTACVSVEGGVGVCACDDQLSGPGQYCGLVPTSNGYEVYACATGATCVANRCHLLCTPNASFCPHGQSCLLWGGVYACLTGSEPPPPDAGQGVVGPDGGTSTKVVAGGCGCATGSAGGFGALALLLLGLARRRQTSVERARVPR